MLDIQTVLKYMSLVEPYYILIIIIFGFFGNSVSFVLFAFTDIKKKEASYFLAALSLCDNGFLLTLLMVTLQHFDINIFNKSLIVCKLIVYLTYVFSFLSIWYVVVFTIERFIIVYFPLNRQQICTKRRNMTALIALFIFSLIFYSFSLFTSGLEDPKATQEPTCITLEKWFHVVKVFIVIDTCFTLFIPMTIIFVMNLSIIIKLMKADTTIESQNTRNSRISVQLDHAKASKLYQSKKKCSLLRSMLNCKQKKSHEFTYSSPLMDTENTIFELSGDKNTKRSTIKSLAPSLDAESIHGFGRNTKEHVKHKVSFKDKKTSELNTKESTCKVNMDYRMSLAYATKCNQNRKNSTVSLSFDKGMAFNRKTSYSRTTKMLLVISTCFLILNTPIALCKLWYFLKSLSFISNSNNSEIYYPTENIDHLSNQTNLTFYEAASNLKTFEANPTEEFVERITCYIYYLNFSLNFLLYSAYGSRFRAKLLKSFAFLNRFISKK